MDSGDGRGWGRIRDHCLLASARGEGEDEAQQADDKSDNMIAGWHGVFSFRVTAMGRRFG